MLLLRLQQAVQSRVDSKNIPCKVSELYTSIFIRLFKCPVHPVRTPCSKTSQEATPRVLHIHAVSDCQPPELNSLQLILL